MPAPKRPNTAAATEAVRRRGQETMAAKLREAGWVALSPETIETYRACGGLAADFLRIYLDQD